MVDYIDFVSSKIPIFEFGVEVGVDEVPHRILGKRVDELEVNLVGYEFIAMGVINNFWQRLYP